MTFFNKILQSVYKYIYIHDGETILIKDMAKEIGHTPKTCRKYIKWLIRRELIKKDGKHFSILPT